MFERLNLELRAGRVLAIMGESGVGKSTLLNLLAGSMRRRRPGAARRHRSVGLDDDAVTLLRRRSVGFVFQAFHVLPYLSVEQNVALPLELLGVAASERRSRTAEMLDAVGIARSPSATRANSPAARCSASPSPARWCTAAAGAGG
jgi:putative ABC transport system ATP-binding protein